MASGHTAAYALVQYDRRAAELVLRLVARELGLDEAEPERLHAQLTNLHAADGADKTTREWKHDFGQLERLRMLALALTDELSGPGRRDP
jgi:hypothetical protein